MATAVKTKPTTTKNPRSTEKGVVIPWWVDDFHSFREWFHSADFPTIGRINFVGGMLSVDMSKEELYTHGALKTEIARVLANLLKKSRAGRYWCDGAYISSATADLANKPDGVYVSYGAITTGRIREVEEIPSGFVELHGTPNMVLEVVSANSVSKDKSTLAIVYWEAGIDEYWIVDARGEETEFEILRYGTAGYVSSPKQKGWVKSGAFGVSFRLRRELGEDGRPVFTLDVK